MKGTYKGFEGPKNGGFYTAIIEGQELPTRFFGCGKKPPTTASGTTVEFEVTEKEVGDKTYYSIKGALKELGAATPAESVASSGGNYSKNAPKSAEDRVSIEKQVILKAAVEFVVGTRGDAATPAEVVKAFNAFLPLLQPSPAKPKPKPVEDQSQDPDDDIPY